jgi:putative nucleotidyltransferase with HDIG domain
VPIIVDGRVWGVLNLEEVNPHAFGSDDAILAELIAAQLGSTLHRCRLYTELEGAFTTTLAVLSSAMGVKDPYTSAHETEVAKVAVRVAKRMGLSPSAQQTVRYAALLHDIGKIAMPDRILSKPGELDEKEWATMREHTVVGADMLKGVAFFRDVHPLVRSSHERWDGTGYPDRLAGSEIPVGARIVAACDALHAMTSDRPYRAAGSQQEALAELRRCAGTQFDPAVVAALHADLTRVTATNATCDDGTPYVHWQVTDHDGAVIAQDLGLIEPGHMTEHDLRAFEARLLTEFQNRH